MLPSYSNSPFSCCCLPLPCFLVVHFIFVGTRERSTKSYASLWKKSLCCQTVQFVDKVASLSARTRHPLLHSTLFSIPLSLFPLSVPQSTCCFSNFLKVFFVSLRPNEKFGATCCREKAQHAFRRAHKAATYTTRTHTHTHTRSTTENIMKKSLLKSWFQYKFHILSYNEASSLQGNAGRGRVFLSGM